MRPLPVRWSAAGVLSTVLVLGVGGQRPTSEIQTGARVTFSPQVPVQGRLFVVRVSAGDAPAIIRVSGQAAREPLHFEPTGDGAFESLAAVPLSAEGAVEISVVVVYTNGGIESLTPAVSVVPGEYVHERLTVAPRFGAPPDSAAQVQLARDRARARRVSVQAHETPRLWKGKWVVPRVDRVTSGFGNGREFNGQISSRHTGLDLDGEVGDTVVAVARGVVALVDDFLLAGNVVYLNHGSGLLSGYFHLSEQLVVEGDTVQAGMPIGRVGATGRVTGPHLHWVIRYGFISVDPRSLPGLAF